MEQDRLPERRATSGVQKIQLGLLITIALAVVPYIFGAGRGSEKIDAVATEQKAQREQIRDVQSQTARVSGQVLQMATTSNVSELEARITVLEAKQTSNEALLREIKADLTDRLRRIETKIDKQAL
jgi:membrane protein involved in colicin uptake